MPAEGSASQGQVGRYLQLRAGTVQDGVIRLWTEPMDSNYSQTTMRTLPAGEFKQTCLRVLEQVRQTGEVVVITKRGVPVARLVPVEIPAGWLGAMQGTASMADDLVAPATPPGEWSALGE